MNLGNNQGVKPVLMPSSSTVSWKSGDGVSDQFPAGLRVLVVDDDPTCLKILEKMLRNCLYEVTKSNRAEDALYRLRENKNGFDIVISDVHMPDMDGFKLLEHIGLEMDLPVIMMSADDSKSVVMKGVTHGACDYLIKPVRIEALRNIWQHVVRKKTFVWKEFEQSGSADNGGDQRQQKQQQQQQSEEADYSSSANEGDWRNSKRRKEEEDEVEDRDDSSSLKKPRVVWSVELHQQFVAAVNQLGIDKAVPKKILELMNVPGLTRENVASHLQKYRLYLRRLSGVSQHHNGLSNSFMGTQESAFGSMSSLNGLDLQALAATGQLSTQSLATLQARSSIKSAISMPLVDQRNLFSFESPKRFDVGQQQGNNSSSKQMNLLHGIPTNMEPKHLANLQHSQPFVSMNMQVGGLVGGSQGSQSSSLLAHMAAQPQPRPQMLNETSGGSHVSRLPSSMGQPILSNGVLGRTSLVENVLESVYDPASQSSSMVDFSMNHNVDLPGNGFPLAGNSGISRKGLIQEDSSNNFEMKGSRGGLIPSFDVFSELHQHKSQEWGLPNVEMTFDASQHANVQNTFDVSPSVLAQQGFSPNQKTGQNRNPAFGNTMFSAGEESSGQRSRPTIGGQQHNMFLGGNAPRVKTERFNESSFQNTLYPEQFGQEDLMSALLKQQQEGIGPVDNEFVFDGYSLDNLPV